VSNKASSTLALILVVGFFGAAASSGGKAGILVAGLGLPFAIVMIALLLGNISSSDD
jgi:hypothetical protein